LRFNRLLEGMTDRNTPVLDAAIGTGAKFVSGLIVNRSSLFS